MPVIPTEGVLVAHDVGSLRPQRREVASEGETVFAFWRLTGTFTGAAFYGVTATGRSIDIRGMDRFTVCDGKIVPVFAAYDSMDFAIQCGPLPAIDSPAQRAMVLAINAWTAARRLLRW